MIGLSGRARWQVRKLLTMLARMRKDLPPSARTEAVRRLGWRLGPVVRPASAEDSGPEPTQAPEVPGGIVAEVQRKRGAIQE